MLHSLTHPISKTQHLRIVLVFLIIFYLFLKNSPYIWSKQFTNNVNKRIIFYIFAINACVFPIIEDLEAIFFFITFLVFSKVCPWKPGNLGKAERWWEFTTVLDIDPKL